MAEIKSIGMVGPAKGPPAFLHSPPSMASTSGFRILTLKLSPEPRIQFLTTVNANPRRAVADDALRRLLCTSNLEDFGSVDLVIESIVESEDVKKKKLCTQLDKIVKGSAILASNTSSISITRLASATGRSSQVIGMHFMNPPPIMKLVEIIKGADTSDDTYDATKCLAERTPALLKWDFPYP